jgi:hypothetical protein
VLPPACRYTIKGQVALAPPPANTGSNGTANFTSTSVLVDIVIPSSSKMVEEARVAPLGEAGGKARACQLGVNADSSELVLDCNPPSGTKFAYMGYDEGWKKSKEFPATKRVLWQDPPKLRKKPENCHHIMGPKYKDLRFQKLAAPTTSGFVLRVTLAGTLDEVTPAKRKALEAAVAAVGDIPIGNVKLDSMIAGSVIAQFKFASSKTEFPPGKQAVYMAWVLKTDTDNVKLAGMFVLAASFFDFNALGFHETTSKVPALTLL